MTHDLFAFHWAKLTHQVDFGIDSVIPVGVNLNRECWIAPLRSAVARETHGMCHLVKESKSADF